MRIQSMTIHSKRSKLGEFMDKTKEPTKLVRVVLDYEVWNAAHLEAKRRGYRSLSEYMRQGAISFASEWRKAHITTNGALSVPSGSIQRTPDRHEEMESKSEV